MVRRLRPRVHRSRFGELHWLGDYPEAEAAREDGLVFAYEPTHLLFFGRDASYVVGDFGIELPRMPRSAPFGVVADVAHDRVYVISSAGLVAEIDRISDLYGRTPRVRYHRVNLNGRAFAAAWAGAGKIALWGEDGLGTIDTRTWKTHAIAAGVEQVVATPFGIAAWSTNPVDGLTVYRPDGRRRFQVFVGAISSVQAVGGYLYADDLRNNSRFSVNLRTGKVVGRSIAP